jgi:type IV fimbrial biogenesis protein FimT
MRRQQGMSIVELVVAIAIVAIIMAVVGPSSIVWIQNSQLRNAADSVSNGLQTARLEAKKRNVTVAFQLTDPVSTAWRVCLFDLVTQACSATATDLHSKSASEGSINARVGIETTFTDFATPLSPGLNVPSLVAFDPLGRVSPNSPTNIARVDVRSVALSPADERRLSIAVTAGGQVRMCDPKLVKAQNPQGCA